MSKFYKIVAFVFIFSLISISLYSQNNIEGKIVSAENSSPISGIRVTLQDKKVSTYTTNDGYFKFSAINGERVSLTASGIGWTAIQMDVELPIKNELVISMTPNSVRMNDVYVYGASKSLEKITESPSAINSLDKIEIEQKASSGKIGSLLQGTMGIDVLQNGANDFIINTRGFNGGLHRRVLVLQDGRDAAMPLLGAQEWNSFSLAPDEYSNIEFVRGPAAALYGANAYNGVLNLTSFSPKEVLGTKLSLLGGDYNTFRGDIRHAGLFGNLSYKVTLGHSQMLNYSNRRDSAKYLEYPGIAIEKKVLTEDDRQTKSYYGTVRLDYEFDDSRKIVGEFGYSRNTNETFVFGLGRTLVKDTERPYMRLAYNSEHVNINAHYMQRFAVDTMWLMVPQTTKLVNGKPVVVLGAPLLDASKDFFIDIQHNFDLFDNLKLVWGVSEQLQWIRTFGTSIPEDVDANYTGIYGQLEWNINDMFKLVTSARGDFASIHETQFSPRMALVMNLAEGHNLRISAGRAFQRPNYSELYRLTADAPGININIKAPNFASVQKAINDTLTSLTGSAQNVDLKLDAFRARAVGNENLEVEKILSFEAGYKGIFGKNLYLNIEAYYNRLNDFITNFLPGVNSSIKKWQANLNGDLTQYNALVTEMVMKSLSARDQQRLSDFNGLPTFVVSNANVGQVDEYGFELEARYYFSDELNLTANYSYFGFKEVENTSTQPLVPNTSPHRFNSILTYAEPNAYDASLTLQYSAGFDWLAGTYVGYVPEYTILNLNAGVYLFNSMRIGVNVYNLLDRKFYQVFGGTYLPRYATVKISYEF